MSTAPNTLRRFTILFARWCALLTPVVVGLIILLDPRLPQIDPESLFAGTSQIVGVCFILGAVALTAVELGFSRIAASVLGTLGLVSIICLANFTLGTELIPLSQSLFGRPPDHTLTGGMTILSTSAAFLVTVIGLLPVLTNGGFKRLPISGVISGVIVAALGAALLLNFFTGVPSPSGWGGTWHTPPLTSLTLIVLGLAQVFVVWGHGRGESIGINELQSLLVVSALGGLCIVALLSFVCGVLPVHDRLRVVNDQAIQSIVEGRAAALSEYMRRVRATIAQLSTRTRALELVSELARQEKDPEQVRTDMNLLLNEALSFEVDFVSICRILRDSQNTCFAAAGKPVPAELLSAVAGEPRPLTLGPLSVDGEEIIALSSPIKGERGGVLGVDLFLMSARSLESLLRWTEPLSRQGQLLLGQVREGGYRITSPAIGPQAVSSVEVAENSAEAAAIHRALRREQGFEIAKHGQPAPYIIAFSEVRNTPWALLARVDPRQLDAELRGHLLTAAGGVFCLVALGLFGTYSLILRLFRIARGLEGSLQNYSRQLEAELGARQVAEKTLSEQRAFLRQVIDINPNFIFAKDRDGRFTLVNRAVADAYGTTVDELVGKSDADFNDHSDEVEHFREDDLRVMNTLKELVIPEERITDAQGNVRWLQTVKRPIVNPDGTVSQLLGVATDITERKLNEKKLGELAAIVASSDDAIISSTLDGIITNWNHGAERVYGYKAEEIIGKPVLTLIPPEHAEDVRKLYSLLAMGQSAALETHQVHKDGHIFNASVTVSPIRDSSGNVVAVSAIARDITKRKQTEEELERYRNHLEELVDQRTNALMRTQERVRRSERLASLGALAAGIAHEINNPLGAITLAAHNAIELSKREDPGPILERTCERILTHAKRCAQIVKGVLQFSRQERTEKWPGDLNLIVKSSLELVKELIPVAPDRVRLDIGQGLRPVRMNPIEIEQLIINVVRNSFEAGGSTVRVWLSTENRGDFAALMIRDDGPGMEEEVRRHIFDPFFTTRQEEGGTGLGLSIVHGIVAAHGGSVEIESIPHAGTAVTIILPYDKQEEDQKSS